jgi:hypothetical protein
MSSLRNEITRLLCALMTAGSLAVATPAAADVVTDWNAMAVQFVNASGRPPGASSNIDLAMVHVAIHDAVQAYQHRFRTYGPAIPNAAGSPVAAVAAAAHDVLVARFQIPSINAGLIAQVDSAYTNYLTGKGLAINNPGVAVGQQAAMNIILNRAGDGFFPANPEVFTGSTEPGQWRPTPPGFAPMATPWLGDVTPFVVKDREGLLHEPGPPSLTSGLYTRDYNEVKAWGRRTGSLRTPQQTTMALFFSGNFQTILNSVLRTVAIARLTDIGDSARLFALALVSGADAGINTWNKKRTYDFWRPSTAILNAADDGNPRTEPDAGWLPLINDPPYPEYTSGANGNTSATARTLENFFGSDVWTFDVTTTATEGGQAIAPRTYHRFSELPDDVVEARILLGIHFRFADVVSRRQAKQVADQVFAHAFQALD